VQDSKSTSNSRGFEYTLIIFGAIAVGWIALNEVIALLSGGHHLLPSLRPSLAAFVDLFKTGSPVAGWGAKDRADLPSAPIWWIMAVTLISIISFLTYKLRHLKTHTPAWDPEEATPRKSEVEKTLGEKALLERSKQLRLDKAQGLKAQDLGVLLGRSVDHGSDLWIAPDDSILVVGPPGSGKTSSIVVPAAVESPGAVVTTSTRDEVMRLTSPWRGDRPMWAFCPLDRDVVLPPGVQLARWSPLVGCEDPQIAILRATALVKGGAGFSSGSTTNGDFWEGMSISVLRTLMHAAALTRQGSMRHVVAWASRLDTAHAYVARALARTPQSVWAEEVEAFAKGNPQLVGSVSAGVTRALDAFADPHVLEYCSSTNFHLSDLLAEQGTLFIWGSGPRQNTIAPLVSGLVEAIVEEARQPAGRGHLKTHTTLILDEAANIAPLPTLPQLLSDGGGSGIQVFVIFQSLAQGRHRWSDAEMDAMWDATTLKVILPGLGNADDLDQLARLAGEVKVKRESVSKADATSTTTTTDDREMIWPAAKIRGLPPNHALLFPRRLRPFEIETIPWWKRQDGWKKRQPNREGSRKA